MHARIKEMMKQLVDAPQASLPFKVSELAKRRWMAGSDDGPIVQLELLDDNKRGIIFSIMARDGSGPLRASFLTMLLLEDTIATAHEPFGVCSGEASVTIYRYVDLEEVSKEQMARSLTNFAHLAEVVLGDYLDDSTLACSEFAESAV
jgi:hypothetical protein